MAIVKIYIESNFVAIDDGGTDINYIPNGYSDFAPLGGGNYCAFKSGGQLIKNYSFNYTDVRNKAGAVIGGGTESEVVLYLTTVFNTASGGSGASGFDYTALNYTDLTTNVAPTASEGELAIVYNSQGVWLINRKLKGVYMYQSGTWEYANQELQNILQTALQAGDNVSVLTNDAGYITASSLPPFFNIDLDSAESSVTRVFSGGRTTYTITHNLGTLDIKPVVFRLSDGRNIGWRVERTGVNTVEVSRNGNIADGLFRLVI